MGFMIKKINKVWPKNKLETSNSPERTMTEYQPGGSATLITDKWASNIYNSSKDKLGRWSYVTIKGKRNSRVTVVSAYQVCENSLATAGPSTCWKQQSRQHRKRGYKEPDPRRLFFKDFKILIDQRIENNEELIIGIDANETDGNGM
eukprot:11019215-Ditylum_brightwellii.AAC.1